MSRAFPGTNTSNGLGNNTHEVSFHDWQSIIVCSEVFHSKRNFAVSIKLFDLQYGQVHDTFVY